MSDTCRSLYVHVPYCRTICGYCDFYSQLLDRKAVEPLLRALKQDWNTRTTQRPCRMDTIFVGGGTPTVLPAAQLAALLDWLRALANPEGVPLEFTVEANPATVSAETARVLADAGVTRVSLGAQSFHPAELRTLDRTHRPEDVVRTVETCRAHGAFQISLDLIFAIPGQTLKTWKDSVVAALALAPDHLSCYGLTYEPGTPLHANLEAGRVQRADEDLEADMYEYILDALPAAGLPRYEISNFARPGAACRHNLRYWNNEPYVGLGPSAAGYIAGVRYKNVSDTAAYVRAVLAGESPWAGHERLDDARRQRETAMLALRTAGGIDRAAFAARFGIDPLDVFHAAIARHVGGGLLEVDDAGIRLTRRGVLLANVVMADFL